MRINDKLWAMMLIGLFSLTVLVPPVFAEASAEAAAAGHAWWFWPIILFIVTFIMGILAVLGGVGGVQASSRDGGGEGGKEGSDRVRVEEGDGRSAGNDEALRGVAEEVA